MAIKLTWRFIRPASLANTSSLTIFDTLKTQVQNSGSFWRTVETPNTGSTSILLTPVTASYSGSLFVVIANNVTGSAAFAAPDTPTPATATLAMGVCWGSASFLGPQNDNPFSGSNTRWTKYWAMGLTTSLSRSFIIESEESIFVGFQTAVATLNYAGLAGAIIETYTTGMGFNDGVLYGMMTAGTATGPGASFWSSTGGFVSHSSTTRNPHAGVLIKSGSGFNPIQRSITCLSTNENFVIDGNPDSDSLTAWKVRFYDATDYGGAQGYLRGCWISSDFRNLDVIRSGSVECGVAFADSNVTVQDALLFAPLSGSGISPV